MGGRTDGCLQQIHGGGGKRLMDGPTNKCNYNTTVCLSVYLLISLSLHPLSICLSIHPSIIHPPIHYLAPYPFLRPPYLEGCFDPVSPGWGKVPWLFPPSLRGCLLRSPVFNGRDRSEPQGNGF